MAHPGPSPSERSYDNWWRAGGVFGILFVILFFIGPIAMTGDTPTRSDSVEEIRAYFLDDGDLYRVGDYIGGIAFIFFFLPYLVILRWVLGSGEGWPAIGSWMTTIGGILLVALGGSGALFFGGLAIAADDPESFAAIDDSTIRMLIEMNAYAFTGFTFSLGLFVGSASLVVLKSGVLWRWLAAIGLVAAVVLIVSAGWPIDGDDEGVIASGGFLGAPLTMLWIILSSINMLLMKEEPVSKERSGAV